MARSTVHPESLKEVNSIEVTQEIMDFAKETSKDVASEAVNRSEWEKKIDKLRNLRYGYRIPKINPWKNCANYSIPLMDTHINSIKPAYVSLAYGVSPICTFEPFGGEDIDNARKKETLFDWRMRTKVKFFNDYCIGTDKELEQGIVVYKTTWEYTTRNYTEFLDIEDLNKETQAVLYDERTKDNALYKIIVEELGVDDEFEENDEEVKRVIAEFREGGTDFEMTLVEVEHNRACVEARDVREDLMIPIDTLELQQARFIKDNVWKTKNQIKESMRDEKYETYTDDIIDKWGTQKDKGISKHQDETILLQEVCVWYDINDDGIKERCILTYPESAPEDVLRFIEIPYEHGLFPYEDVRRELNDAGFYKSRGVCELDEDYQIGITMAVNQAEDNGTIVNKPTIVKRRNATSNIKNRSYVPGEEVTVNNTTDDYKIIQMTNTSQPALLQFSQYLKAWADSRLGNITAGSSSPTNIPGQAQGGKKTKAEINMLEGLQGKVEALDIKIHQQQMAKVYYQIDALYEQYGDEEEEILTTGEAPQKVNRREIQGKRDIVPNGRLDNTNPQLRAQKAFNLMQVYMGDPDINQYELKKLHLEDYDSRIAKRILYSLEDKSRMEQHKTAMLQQLKDKALGEQIDMKQIEMMLDIVMEQNIAMIHGRKFAPDEATSKGKPKKPKEEKRP